MEKILIVDDDAFILDMYVIKFREKGYDVVIAKNGQEALDQAEAHHPDVILLDVIMPVMDGFEVLQKLKTGTTTKDIPVIMLTNLGQKEDVERGMKLGAVDYIIKAHFTPSEAVEKVSSFLRKNKEYHA